MTREGSDADRAAGEDLARRVRIFLASHHRPALGRLQVEASGGRITLRGSVGSFYEKQLSYQCCRRVAGVHEVVDLIDVMPSVAAKLVSLGSEWV